MAIFDIRNCIRASTSDAVTLCDRHSRRNSAAAVVAITEDAHHADCDLSNTWTTPSRELRHMKFSQGRMW
jgi:hypothetical protein